MDDLLIAGKLHRYLVEKIHSAKYNGPWKVTWRKLIRNQHGECPLRAAARHIVGYCVSLDKAITVLNLSENEANMLLAACDNQFDQPRLRRAILGVLQNA